MVENINQNLEVAEKSHDNTDNYKSNKAATLHTNETCNSNLFETPFNEPLH